MGGAGPFPRAPPLATCGPEGLSEGWGPYPTPPAVPSPAAPSQRGSAGPADPRGGGARAALGLGKGRAEPRWARGPAPRTAAPRQLRALLTPPWDVPGWDGAGREPPGMRFGGLRLAAPWLSARCGRTGAAPFRCSRPLAGRSERLPALQQEQSRVRGSGRGWEGDGESHARGIPPKRDPVQTDPPHP